MNEEQQRQIKLAALQKLIQEKGLPQMSQIPQPGNELAQQVSEKLGGLQAPSVPSSEPDVAEDVEASPELQDPSEDDEQKRIEHTRRAGFIRGAENKHNEPQAVDLEALRELIGSQDEYQGGEVSEQIGGPEDDRQRALMEALQRRASERE